MPGPNRALPAFQRESGMPGPNKSVTGCPGALGLLTQARQAVGDDGGPATSRQGPLGWLRTEGRQIWERGGRRRPMAGRVATDLRDPCGEQEVEGELIGRMPAVSAPARMLYTVL